MSEQNLQPTRKEIEAHIIAKAWKDEAYKQELLTNPKAVIEQEFGIHFAEEVNLKVLEENPSTLYFVLPMSPMATAEELSEEQLEEVAGGLFGAAITVAYLGYEAYKNRNKIKGMFG